MNSLRKTLLRIMFLAHKAGIHLGIYVLPAHYYVSIPNILELMESKGVWTRKSELPGIDMDLSGQEARLKEICMPYQHECAGNTVYKEAVAMEFGPGFGYVEAQALHGVIRHFRPRRVIEVGSGVSTRCMLSAVEKNEAEYRCGSRITCIEPYPSDALSKLRGIELIMKPVQTTPFELYRELGRGDLLFIDSTHTVKPGGDVNYLVLEVLPRLRQGVIVHFHDIYLPYDYPRDVLQTLFHGSETSLLHAFLINNAGVRIIFCLSQLHYERRDTLKRVFPEYRPQADDEGMYRETVKPFDYPTGHFPSSIYIEIE